MRPIAAYFAEMFTRLAFAVTALCLFGCHQTIVVAAPNGASPPSTRQVSWTDHYFYGFIGRENVDLRDYCHATSVLRVELESDIPTLLATVVTLGIYFPRRLTVTCKEARAR